MKRDPWLELRRYTQARIALGSAGHALPTAAHLDFCEAHAAARDAVKASWSVGTFATELAGNGVPSLTLTSSVSDRDSYLRRPDLGRRLSAESRAELSALAARERTRVALILSDGLSALALERHGVALLRALLPALVAAELAPLRVLLLPLARVAIGDDVGALLGADLSLVLLGERPGLSAADGLGAYLTFAPSVGKTDADRNCVSNIRPPDGLDIASAVGKIVYLSSAALTRRVSGVELKDDSLEPPVLPR